MASKPFRHWTQWVFAAAAILFFFGSLILVNPSNLYVSPDETANAFFGTRFSETGSFSTDVNELSLILGDRIHPRSTVSHEGMLKPGSFLGLPFLYGLIAMVLGSWVFWVLTPLMAIVAAEAWRRIMQHLMSPELATLSAGIFLLHPALWYYSARGLMHNVLFVSVLVIGVWMLVDRPVRQKKKVHWLNDPLGGFLLMLALMVRTSELWWVIGLALIGGLVFFPRLSFRRVGNVFLGVLVGAVLMLGANTLVYGGPFVTGYTVGLENVSIDLTAGDSVDGVAIFPFGIHPRSAWLHFNAYGVQLFWWLSVLTVLGVFTFLADKKRRLWRWVFTMSFVLIGAWLVLMYGSWEIHDNPDPSQITMANSYVRYWLPMYLMSSVFVASAIGWMIQRGRTPIAKGLFVGGFCLFLLGLSINTTFVHGDDALLQARQSLLTSSEIQASVLSLVEADAVVIVDRADKLFFPHRNVWYPLRDEATYDAMPILVEHGPLYYYGITFPDVDLTYLNESRLKRMGLQIERLETYHLESLYRIYPE
ncbi:hypothetical protein CO174_03585 [Candidatus Uhrbacteria bacterium CG_4_9_14_3_um_filter_50_9]|uniref:Glycosyltransferase RgtA/B/C/D-like domain-containing protein n=1 Tax=Candidatus Uhrbacteria bacterium CG_4_9_14_3_um_filter_50_9 TaxID=1975035 RepID=A0A2M7XBV8_9BACT|nr:MAG: hypothetical protein CO174_03585 [Candidatus Uhrbacteria bacterium CG_4_9_14_3_um_filter_50_9]